MSERVVVMTFFGIAEKDVERLFACEVVFRFVCVPDFGPASCGVFFHIKKYSRLGVRVKGFFQRD